MSRLELIPDRIGVCQSRSTKAPGLFHRGKVHLSRKFRVWLVPGNETYIELDPEEFRKRYKVVQEYTPITTG